MCVCVCVCVDTCIENYLVWGWRKGEKIGGDTKECVHRRRNALLIPIPGDVNQKVSFLMPV